MRKAEALIVNKAGLHARAAAKLVAVTSRFSSEVRIGRGTRSPMRENRVEESTAQKSGRQETMIDGKSILALMMLAAVQGTSLRIEADGADEEEALALIVQLIEDGFGENP